MIKSIDNDPMILVEQNWEKYNKFKDMAEQHMFSTLLYFDLKLEPLYKDLHVNESTHHAKVFNLYMKKVVFPALGID